MFLVLAGFKLARVPGSAYAYFPDRSGYGENLANFVKRCKIYHVLILEFPSDWQTFLLFLNFVALRTNTLLMYWILDTICSNTSLFEELCGNYFSILELWRNRKSEDIRNAGDV